jgi:hypothetical protein
VYIICGLFSSSFVTNYVIVVVLLMLDFWTVGGRYSFREALDSYVQGFCLVCSANFAATIQLLIFSEFD